ncbi:hypothetical protein BGZ94_004213 [Podila epigama]|nr:hypothetical protein BGZ94_004213 [Podila epigama]
MPATGTPIPAAIPAPTATAAMRTGTFITTAALPTAPTPAPPAPAAPTTIPTPTAPTPALPTTIPTPATPTTTPAPAPAQCPLRLPATHSSIFNGLVYAPTAHGVRFDSHNITSPFGNQYLSTPKPSLGDMADMDDIQASCASLSCSPVSSVITDEFPSSLRNSDFSATTTAITNTAAAAAMVTTFSNFTPSTPPVSSDVTFTLTNTPYLVGGQPTTHPMVRVQSLPYFPASLSSFELSSAIHSPGLVRHCSIDSVHSMASVTPMTPMTPMSSLTSSLSPMTSSQEVTDSPAPFALPSSAIGHSLGTIDSFFHNSMGVVTSRPPLPHTSDKTAVPQLNQRRGSEVSPVKSRLRRASSSPDGAVFTCTFDDCGKLFKRSEHLKRHVRSLHTQERPYICPAPDCPKRFSRSDNLNQHLRVHRLDKQKAPAASELVPCPLVQQDESL